MSSHGLKRVAAIAAVIGSLLFAAAPAAAGPPVIGVANWDGSCAISLVANGATTFLPAPAILDITGGGTCVTNAGVATIRFFDMTLHSAPWGTGYGCAGGHAGGLAHISVDIPNFPLTRAQITLVNTGGTIEMVAIYNTVVFTGVGILESDPAQMASCATNGSVSQMTWTGSFTFQDPVVTVDEA